MIYFSRRCFIGFIMKSISYVLATIFSVGFSCNVFGMDFKLFPIDTLSESEKAIVFSPAVIKERLVTDSSLKDKLVALVDRPTYNMIVGDSKKNEVALRNWVIFYNACNMLGGKYLDRIEQGKDALKRRFGIIDAYVDDMSKYHFHFTGILEQLAIFDKSFCDSLIETYEKGLYTVPVNHERAQTWRAFSMGSRY